MLEDTLIFISKLAGKILTSVGRAFSKAGIKCMEWTKLLLDRKNARLKAHLEFLNRKIDDLVIVFLVGLALGMFVGTYIEYDQLKTEGIYLVCEGKGRVNE